MSSLEPAYQEKWLPNFDFYDLHPPPENLIQEVETGLRKSQKSISPKFFYDEKGSDLFHQITRLPEYYLTRTEIGLLSQIHGEITGYVGDDAHLIEYGCGSSQKIRLLLDALERPRAYLAVDISKSHLFSLCQILALAYPEITVAGVCTDYMAPFHLPSLPKDGKRVAFFPGSSIGNFDPEEAIQFLKNIRRTLGTDSGLLIGVDLKKDPPILHAAYNDAAGITAQFNLNLLERINRECGARFTLSYFTHQAFYNEREGRVEMHLVSLKDQWVQLKNFPIRLREGETIHTENSYKYTIEEFQNLSRKADWKPVRVWTDPNHLFSIHFLRC